MFVKLYSIIIIVSFIYHEFPYFWLNVFKVACCVCMLYRYVRKGSKHWNKRKAFGTMEIVSKTCSLHLKFNKSWIFFSDMVSEWFLVQPYNSGLYIIPFIFFLFLIEIKISLKEDLLHVALSQVQPFFETSAADLVLKALWKKNINAQNTQFLLFLNVSNLSFLSCYHFSKQLIDSKILFILDTLLKSCKVLSWELHVTD